ncbi:MAG TPA: glycine/sarcosine/betaine reductase complex component C subunit beta [Candidatus Limnocylindrales bacterium]|nr:glycine/sarcosine/betaine reductase complex component C subunit beta [Candidatus Limnocylindrales bacterium]
MGFPVIKGMSCVLAHVPDLVIYGSKPRREKVNNAGLYESIKPSLRNYDQVKNYPPHQVFIGNLKPEDLWGIEKPWFENLLSASSRYSPGGEIMPQDEFYGLIKIVDEFDLVYLAREFADQIRPKLESHQLFHPSDIERLGAGVSLEKIEEKISAGALPFMDGNELVGCIQDGHDEDENLKADILLENLACKASGVLAMRSALHSLNEDPAAIDFVMNCGEEGVGDRYQRGAGNLAKAMAEVSGCCNCSGADIKAFCCAPIHTMVLAGSLVHAGVFNKVIVVGGGSLAKLGMKMKGHLGKSIPIMEDVLAAFAVIVGPDDGCNPQIRLDVIGKHDVGAGSSQQSIYESLVKKPLDKLGMKIPEINKYSTELHNPEITEPAGSGNVPRNNYRMIAGLAVMHGQLQREELDTFERKYGMPGFSPTQGHIPSAIPYLGHACKAILQGEIENVMFVGKGSLFLAKMTNLSDGMSFIIEKNKGCEQ